MNLQVLVFKIRYLKNPTSVRKNLMIDQSPIVLILKKRKWWLPVARGEHGRPPRWGTVWKRVELHFITGPARRALTHFCETEVWYVKIQPGKAQVLLLT